MGSLEDRFAAMEAKMKAEMEAEMKRRDAEMKAEMERWDAKMEALMEAEMERWDAKMEALMERREAALERREAELKAGMERREGEFEAVQHQLREVQQELRQVGHSVTRLQQLLSGAQMVNDWRDRVTKEMQDGRPGEDFWDYCSRRQLLTPDQTQSMRDLVRQCNELAHPDFTGEIQLFGSRARSEALRIIAGYLATETETASSSSRSR